LVRRSCLYVLKRHTQRDITAELLSKGHGLVSIVGTLYRHRPPEFAKRVANCGFSCRRDQRVQIYESIESYLKVLLCFDVEKFKVLYLVHG